MHLSVQNLTYFQDIFGELYRTALSHHQHFISHIFVERGETQQVRTACSLRVLGGAAVATGLHAPLAPFHKQKENRNEERQQRAEALVDIRLVERTIYPCGRTITICS